MTNSSALSPTAIESEDENYAARWAAALDNDRRRVVILDDDPTGSQSASGVGVLMEVREKALAQFFASRQRCIYLVTNTRAMSESRAVSRVAETVALVRAVASQSREDVAFVLRGDSTLRGHVFAEIGALASRRSRVLFVPAFLDGGRTTIDGVHFIELQGIRIPVSETEFAHDPIFGFESSKLSDWVKEKADGRPTASIHLDALRAQGPSSVARALRLSSPGAVVIPDVEDADDLLIVALGLLAAERQGVDVVVRSAASFAALRGGTVSKALASIPGASQPTLFVCGSYTAGANLQLEALKGLGVSSVEIATSAALVRAPTDIAAELSPRLRPILVNRGAAILATERVQSAQHISLEIGARVMAALVETARQVLPMCRSVVVKGGITSAEVAAALSATGSGTVLGQFLPGVSVWLVEGRERELPIVVVPGNVGDEHTLTAILESIRSASHRPHLNN